ncbi:hypothetical protein OTU49_003999, partial [Cherax quadricarinatus]
MDGFGDSFVPLVEGSAPAAEVDPAAEFLAREQDQLAGLGDDILPATLGQDQSTVASGLGGEADLFGCAPVNGGPDLESFEMLGGDEVAQDPAPPVTTSEPDLARSPIPHVVREDPEKIKIWREQQRIRLEQK